MQPIHAAPLALLALAACHGGEGLDARTPDPASAVAWSFDEPVGGLPAGWRVATTNPRASRTDARWEVRSEAAGSPALALVDPRDSTGSAYNLCWTPVVRRTDVELEVRVRAGGGGEDRGGGPAWRILGPDDYYVARWNPLEDNFRVYVVEGGRRTQLAGADVALDPDAWHVIRIEHVGSGITCTIDGGSVLRAVDATHVDAGGVGVWTKADATTAFDDLAVR